MVLENLRFGLFLSGLFSDPKSKEFKVSYKKLSRVDERIAKKILNHNKNTKCINFLFRVQTIPPKK